MGLATATLEMQNPEETRERLHGMVKETRTVIVLSGTGGEAIMSRSADTSERWRHTVDVVPATTPLTEGRPDVRLRSRPDRGCDRCHGVSAGARGLLELRGMGLATATLEMQNPEETRERLHGMVKETRTVIVLSGTGGEAIDGRPMALVGTDDDTTMVLATSLDAAQAEELERNPRVTVVLQGAGYALFTGDARVSRERAVIADLWTEAWRQWSRGKQDPTLAVVTIDPIEGSYWEAKDRHSYVYRLVD